MKRTIGIFSLAMLLFSIFTPSFTYATGEVEDEAIEILSYTLVDSMNTFENSHGTANILQPNENYKNLFGQSEETENDEIEIVGNNNHILWNKTKKYITVYNDNYSTGITIKDKNLGASKYLGEEGATDEEVIGDYYQWGKEEPISIDNYETEYSTPETREICEQGFHIPKENEWDNLKNYYHFYDNYGVADTSIFEKLKLPFGGLVIGIENNEFIYNDDFNPKGRWGFYRANQYNTGKNEYKVLAISADNGGIFGVGTSPRKVGATIRCFKDEYVPYLLPVTFNPNGGAFSGMEVNVTKTYEYQTNENGIVPIYNIQIPNKEATGETGWMFDGWYTKDGTNNDWGEEFDISNPNSTTAYAKWLPFNDLDLSIIGLTGVKIMDRNLGAEKTADGTYYGYNNAGHEEYSRLGKYYQWGNNYGFKNNGTIEHSDNNPVDATSYGPKNYYMNNTFKTTSWSEAWTTESNENLWGGKEPKNPDTDKQGPCPEGYHVPDKIEWELVYNSFESKRTEEGSTLCDGFEENKKGKCFAAKMLLPFAGKRGYTTQKYDYQGGMGYYWSSTPYIYGDDAKYLSLHDDYISADPESKRSFGYSVRCFKNSSNKLTLNTDNGEDIINVRRWEEIGEYLKDIYYKGYKILGWYYDTNQSIEINNSDIIKENKKIYAKWERNPWYTYNSNNGIFSDGHNERIIKSDLVKTVVTIENQKDVLRTNYFKGASSLSIGLEILNWDPGLDDEIDIYTGDSENGNPYKVISPECDEYYGCINYYGFEIPSDTITIVIHGSTANENTSYSATINANGADPYKIDKFEETPTRQGYEFSGWYEGTTGENNELIIADEKFNFEDTSVTQDRTLYAKWNPHHYTIKFNVNGGTGEIENINAIYGIGIPLPTITREGYNFEGWLSDIDNNIYSGTIEEGTGLTSEDNVIVNLTAQWKSIPAEPGEQTVSSAGGGATINSLKQESKTIEQEHDSADLEKIEVEEVKSTQTTTSPTIKENVKKVEGKTLTRGEVAVMTNILLDVYPQLTENRELNEVSKACENYTDEQNFTKDEKKAITRLCKLSIMGIHADDNKPLEEFLVNDKSTNNEFSKVINRSLESYTEKDFSVVKNALKKLEGDEENVVFGTVYDVFMSIKNIFN